jgi:hypothetical protein
MKQKLLRAIALSVGVFLWVGPLAAHHGSAAFDVGKQLTMKGTVTEWFWANPHCFLQFDVKGDDGKSVHWIAETSNPPDMVNAGWSKTSLKPGDQVTITVEPVKSGKPVAHLLEVKLADGKVLSAWGGTKGANDRAQTRKEAEAKGEDTTKALGGR